jgi:acylphosphatase
MTKQRQLHVIVKGYVHGVGFRFFVLQSAKSRNLKGWVRNRMDGSVEVKAQGYASDLEILLSQLEKGPEMAQIMEIQKKWNDELEDLPSFTVLTTS